MNRSIDACFADEKVVIYHRNMVFGQLDICYALVQQNVVIHASQRTKLRTGQ